MFKTKKIDWVAFHLRRSYRELARKESEALKAGKLDQALGLQKTKGLVLDNLIKRHIEI